MIVSSPRPLLRNPLLWVSSLYLAMGIPFNIIMGGTAARMYKSLGYSDGQITVVLGSIGVAWSLKPLWAAFLDMYRTKKFFVLVTELLISGILVAVAMSLPGPGFFQVSTALFWIMAFASSTQDICADGIYLTALEKPVQARLAGVQSTFWVLGKVLATGVVIAGFDRVRAAQSWSDERMWQAVLLTCAGGMALLATLHYFRLPVGSVSDRPESARQVGRDFVGTAVSFFHKRNFWGMIAFVFLYRLGEGLILLEGQLFLQSPVAQGGLGLTAGQVSNIDALWGTGFSIAGGLLGGMFVSRYGLWRCLGILGLCLNIPHFTYVYLSQAAAAGHGIDYVTVVVMVSIEKFGYGFGFVGNMIYMMQQLAPGRSTMTHYAFATALMNLVLVPTNMVSGPLAEMLGFSTFFIVVMFASVPSAWAAFKAPFPHRGEQAAGETAAALLDDPARHTPAERTVQLLAGRASMQAMLIILTILLFDAGVLGTLQGLAPGEGKVQFWLLVGSLGLKYYLARRASRLAREARAVVSGGGSVYLGNARGALVATGIGLLMSIFMLAFAAHRTFEFQ